MSGYYHDIMSNNAYSAFQNGIMPMDYWNRERIFAAVRKSGSPHAQEILAQCQNLPFDALKRIFLRYHAGHHVGRRHLRVPFYSVELRGVTPEFIRRIAAEYPTSTGSPVK